MLNLRFITKPLILLACGHLVTDLSQGALPALLPFLKAKFALSYVQVGFIVLLQNITSSVIQPIFGYLSDKISMPKLLPLGILVSGLGMSATGLVNSYYLMIATIIVGGLGVAAFHPQGSKSTHFVSSITTRGSSMGFFSVGGNLGLALGTILMSFLLSLSGGLNNTIYFALPAVIMALLFWLNMTYFMTTPQEKSATSPPDKSAQQSINFAFLSLLLAVIFVRSSIHTGLTTYIPLYYSEYLGGSPVYASYLLAAYLMTGVVGTFIGAALSDRYGRKTVIMFSMLGSLPFLILLPYTSGMATLIVLGAIGLILVSSFATTLVFAQEMMPGYIGIASGLTVGFSIGLGGLGATILGYIADNFGIANVFSILAVMPIVGAFMTTFLPGKTSTQVKSST
ncbi:Fosmidomycin resistance protein [bioreactor metagenome]|uniref:Fosmidomycin resistance protein n=1 Tax=bioreactor metagenome TaxID=1076179 RepID=A0A644TBF6_9ZZZZ|nr:MFS transporter [Negativicutes bacterium]